MQNLADIDATIRDAINDVVVNEKYQQKKKNVRMIKKDIILDDIGNLKCLDLETINYDTQVIFKKEIVQGKIEVTVLTDKEKNDITFLKCNITTNEVSIHPVRENVSALAVKVILPLITLEKVNITNKNGIVAVTNARAETIEIKGHNTAVKLKNNTIASLDIATTNCDVVIKDIYFLGKDNKIICENRNGNIILLMNDSQYKANYVCGELSSKNGENIMNIPDMSVMEKDNKVVFSNNLKSNDVKVEINLVTKNNNITVSVSE